jgi:integrase
LLWLGARLPGGQDSARLIRGRCLIAARGDVRCLGRIGSGYKPWPKSNASGPYDLRHTFATWLEDAGIPSHVIDELMGH